ncbi:MAG: competence/damage-inducible protein A [Fimbriimonadales bacterium]
MTAEIVAIGTELLVGDIADTNSQILAKLFVKLGINHYRRVVVGDNLERATLAIREALARADLVFTIGGLGPTPDDLTREAIAAATDDSIEVEPHYLEYLKRLMNERKRPWLEAIGKMAERPSRAKLLSNHIGTAPGLRCQVGDKIIIALPGPPAELISVLNDAVEPWLRERSTAGIYMKTFRVIGIPESTVCDRLGEHLNSSNPTFATYAKKWEVHIRLTTSAQSRSQAEESARPYVELIRDLFGNSLYGEDDEDLAEIVCRLLKERKQTLAIAESCTGGMLGERITSVPGCSEVFLGGFITYSNEMKARELSVARTELMQYGAVSEPIARQMSEGAVRQTNSTYGLAITGIAGPDGGSPEKPVGLVFIALASPRGTEVSKNQFPGDRELVRYRATQVALNMLREELLRS